eukprot:10522345-Alexandrium_andersonii.AAC.1
MAPAAAPLATPNRRDRQSRWRTHMPSATPRHRGAHPIPLVCLEAEREAERERQREREREA